MRRRGILLTVQGPALASYYTNYQLITMTCCADSVMVPLAVRMMYSLGAVVIAKALKA